MQQLLKDRYEPIEVLARNPVGETMRAFDHLHECQVVLRIVPVIGDRDALHAAARALLAVAAHPGLPSIRDDFLVDDRYAFVADWVEGTTVAQLLVERGDPGITVPIVLRILGEIAGALDHLHAHDPPVVHGRVRPANVVVRDDGHATLVGLDLRERVRVSSSPMTPADDIHALAAMALEMLTGSPPSDVRPRWEGVEPESAKVFDRALRHALSADRARRPRTAGELVDRLRAWDGASLPTGVVTFCLTDIEGSTELWEAHPSVMTSVIARHHELVADAVADHGGHLPRSQGEGDSTLSAFARASDAVDAALAMQRSLADEPWASSIRLRIRTGLHTGEAQVQGGDYFGAAISRTARIRALASGGQVLLSQATAHLVADGLPADAELVDLGEVVLKGLARPERVFQMIAAGLEIALVDLGLSAVTLAEPIPIPAALRPAAPRLIGRALELEALRSGLTRVASGEPHVALVSGDPGMGKSVLMAEFAHRAHEEMTIVLYGRCYEENLIPYQPFIEALCHYTGHVDKAVLRADVLRAGSMLCRLLPDLERQLPGLPDPARAEPDTERFLLFEAVNAFLAGIASHDQLLLMLDDLQWADGPTLALLSHIARSAPAQVFVVGSFRADEVDRMHPLALLAADLRRESRLDVLELHGLDGPDLAELVSAFAGHDAPADFVQALALETEGNPFFVAEVLRHLVESEVIYQRDGEWVSDLAIEELGLPDSIHDVIARRLRRLAEPVSKILLLASVIGREFDLALVERLTDVDVGTLIDLLDEAVAAAVVREIAAGRYTFAHALIRESLYAGISATRRARVHGSVLSALLERYGDPPTTHLAELAHHALRAGELVAGVTYARSAGDEAMTQLAHEEAARWYERALAALGEDAEASLRCDLLIVLADANRTLSGGVASARALYVEAAETARRIGDAGRLARAATGPFRGYYAPSTDSDEVVRALLVEALDALGDGDLVLRSRVLARLTSELYFTAEHERCDALSREAVELARRAGDDDALMQALVSRHHALQDPAHCEERAALSEEILEVADRTTNVESSAQGWFLRAHDSLEAGDADDAEQARAIGRKLGSKLGDDLVWLWLDATWATMTGRFGDAERFSAEALTAGEQAHHPDASIVFGTELFALRWLQGRLEELVEPAELLVAGNSELPMMRALLALMYIEAARLDDAHREFEALLAEDLTRVPRDYVWMGGMVGLAEVCASLHDEVRAAALYEMIDPYADQVVVVGPAIACYGSMHRTAGLLASVLSHWDDAERHYAAAFKANQRLGARPWVARGQHDWARMLLTRLGPGDVERADELLQQARATALDLGMVRLLQGIDDALAATSAISAPLAE